MMIVKNVMTTDVRTCRPDTNLAEVAKTMWDADCGVVPILDGERSLVGVITDRDICIAAATRSTSPANIRTEEVTSGTVFTCRQDDDVRNALQIMRDRRVRRLPVLDDRERLVGIVSLSDLVAETACRRAADVPGDEFLETLKSICAHSQAPVTA